jgi:hypothetical protein
MRRFVLWAACAAAWVAAGCDAPTAGVDAMAAAPGGPDAGAPDAGAPDATPLLEADATPPDAAPCEADGAAAATTLRGHCYLLFLHATDWPSAHDRCAALVPPGHLVTIADPAENVVVAALAGDRSVWIGASDLALEGVFVWITGEPFAYTNWGAGEPNNASGAEDCVELQGHRGGAWNDYRCWRGQAYVCEQD